MVKESAFLSNTHRMLLELAITGETEHARGRSVSADNRWQSRGYVQKRFRGSVVKRFSLARHFFDDRLEQYHVPLNLKKVLFFRNINGQPCIVVIKWKLRSETDK
ncbi:jg8390 [Pararge aegeria aegeria]|uniref:Jg8390 protein n=1 Tax=Pararge aegeria aegeria TaxID=348720 RepID=A0A8S4SGY3_9NEOP|nr:jg8390 [Pararge aegeria aegeria]